MDKLIIKLQRDYPNISFESSKYFYWSPNSQTVFYRADIAKESADWSILHELSHALLGHSNYRSDFELLKMEVSAWEKAKRLQNHYSINIKPDHIQSCLDTYREWLYRRSTCPSCNSGSLQLNSTTYNCINCHTTWKVTAARFCRPYRRITLSQKERLPERQTQVIFS